MLVRFGKWQDIIQQNLPEDQALYASTTAMMRYVKSVAHSAMGKVGMLNGRRPHSLVPDPRRVHNNLVVDILEIVEAVLDGALEY